MSNTEAVFWTRVRFGGTTPATAECWEWQGTRAARYGKFGIGGRKWLPHRYIWTILMGSIPNGLEVCHSCDNTFCVRPAHLFLGTPCRRRQRWPGLLVCAQCADDLVGRRHPTAKELRP